MPEALPGWYPDPDGDPGRFRYWDGSRWSTATTDDPRAPRRRARSSVPTPTAESGSAGRASRKRRLADHRCARVAADLRLSRVVIFGGRPAGRSSDAFPHRPLSRSGRLLALRRQRPTNSVDVSDPVGARCRCPKGNPDSAGAAHPIDDRVYGGNLSFDQQPTFEPAGSSHASPSLTTSVTAGSGQPEPRLGSRSSRSDSCAPKTASSTTTATPSRSLVAVRDHREHVPALPARPERHPQRKPEHQRSQRLADRQRDPCRPPIFRSKVIT